MMVNLKYSIILKLVS